MKLPYQLNGIPYSEYDAIDATRASHLKNLGVSPRCYRWNLDNPHPGTAPMRIGRSIHCATLEPDDFEERWPLWNGKRVGGDWDDFHKSVGGVDGFLESGDYLQVYGKTDELSKILAMRDAIHDHPVAGPILREADAVAEATIVWQHEATGLRLKCRADLLGTALTDVKSTVDPHPDKFEKQSANFGYHEQLALYRMGVEALYGGRRPTRILCVQNQGPYDVVVYDIAEEVLEVGLERVEGLLHKLARHRKLGHWPGHFEEPITLNLPSWAMPDIDVDWSDVA